MKTMYYYKTKIRLGGSTTNEVQKLVTAPEFLVLQFIHGSDALTEVEELKNEKINLRDEKERLKSLYNVALAKRKQSIDTIFGPLGTVQERLPVEMLDQFNIEDGELPDFSEEDVIKFARKRGSRKTVKAVEVEAGIERMETLVSQEEINVDDLME